MSDTTGGPSDSFLERLLSTAPDNTDNMAGAAPASDERVCSECGVPLEADWQFCGVCGSDLTADLNVVASTSNAQTWETIGPDETPVNSDEPTTSLPNAHPLQTADSHTSDLVPGRGSRRQLVSRVAIAFSIILLTAAAVAGWLAYNNSQGKLSETRHQLSDTKGSLAFTKDQLAATRGELTKTQSTLDTTQDELNTTKGALAKSQGSLNNAQDRLDLQASQIDTLQTCLRGVSEALTDVAYGDYVAAGSALDSVGDSCRKASDIL